jgi:hypothetical protein
MREKSDQDKNYYLLFYNINPELSKTIYLLHYDNKLVLLRALRPQISCPISYTQKHHQFH